MPYKRDSSRYYYVRRRNLPGYGDTGRLSSRSTQKRVARDMERLLEDIAQRALLDPSWYELLDGVCRYKSTSLSDLLRAKTSGTLLSLKQNLRDPLLCDAKDAYLAAAERNRQTRVGDTRPKF